MWSAARFAVTLAHFFVALTDGHVELPDAGGDAAAHVGPDTGGEAEGVGTLGEVEGEEAALLAQDFFDRAIGSGGNFLEGLVELPLDVPVWLALDHARRSGLTRTRRVVVSGWESTERIFHDWPRAVTFCDLVGTVAMASVG